MRKVIGIVVIVIAIVLALPTVIPTVAGCRVYNVISESMEPEIPVGSMVCAKPISTEHIHTGDVITFAAVNDDGSVITHRVVENDAEAQEFITKGDANDDVDIQPVPYDHYIGKVIWHIPFMGTFGMFFSSMYGKVILLGLILVGWVMISGYHAKQAR